jgi:hypothetical protein
MPLVCSDDYGRDETGSQVLICWWSVE